MTGKLKRGKKKQTSTIIIFLIIISAKSIFAALPISCHFGIFCLFTKWAFKEGLQRMGLQKTSWHVSSGKLFDVGLPSTMFLCLKARAPHDLTYKPLIMTQIGQH